MRFKVEMGFYIDDETLLEDDIEFMLYGMIDKRNEKAHSQITNINCKVTEDGGNKNEI